MLLLKTENAKLKAQTKLHAKAQELLAKWDSLKSSRAAGATASLPSSGIQKPARSASEQQKDGASRVDNQSHNAPDPAASCGTFPASFHAPTSSQVMPVPSDRGEPVPGDPDQSVEQLASVGQEERMRTTMNCITNVDIVQKAALSAASDALVLATCRPSVACSCTQVAEACIPPALLSAATSDAQFRAGEQNLKLPPLVHVEKLGQATGGIAEGASMGTDVDDSPSHLGIPSTMVLASQPADDVWASQEERHAQERTKVGAPSNQLTYEADHGVKSDRQAFGLAPRVPTLESTHATGSHTRRPIVADPAPFQMLSSSALHVTLPLGSGDALEMPLPHISQASLAIVLSDQTQGPQSDENPSQEFGDMDAESPLVKSAKRQCLKVTCDLVGFGPPIGCVSKASDVHTLDPVQCGAEPCTGGRAALSLTRESERLLRSQGLKESHICSSHNGTQASQEKTDGKVPTYEAGTDKPVSLSGNRIASIMDATVWMQWATGGCTNSRSSGDAKHSATSGLRQQSSASAPKLSSRKSRGFLPSLKRSS